MKYSQIQWSFSFLLIIFSINSVFADFAVDTFVTGTSPIAGAVNQVTNRFYIANNSGANVTMFDGGTRTTQQISTGTSPCALAINPVDNKIYVANFGSGNVTVINGATNQTVSISAGTNPFAIAINPATNKIYVANNGSANVTILDGSTNTTATVSAGTNPCAVAVNPVTNKIYIANKGSSNITIIDGVTTQTMTLAVRANPSAVAVNTITNKIYIANNGSGNVSVIDGSTNQVTTVAAGTNPCAIAINQVSNKVFVANNGSVNVTIIDGTSNQTTTVPAGANPSALAVSVNTNTTFVTNSGSNTVSVIDSTGSGISAIPVGKTPNAVIVNPVTKEIAVINSASNSVSLLNWTICKTSTLTLNGRPKMVALNPMTNKAYILKSANYYENLAILNCTTSRDSALIIGQFPAGIAVNPVTNKIYLADNAGKVIELDGITTQFANYTIGSNPNGIAVNPVTNKIYVTELAPNVVVEMDGVTKELLGTISLPAPPKYIAVNPVTNKVYVSNYDVSSSNVTIINGATMQYSVVPVGANPNGIAVNPVTNKIYVAQSFQNGCLSVIDGTTDQVTTVYSGLVGSKPSFVVVNPLTNIVYVGCIDTCRNIYKVNVARNAVSKIPLLLSGVSSLALNPVTDKLYVVESGEFETIDENPTSDTKLTASIDPLFMNSAILATPTITGSAVNRQRPGHTGIWAVQTSINKIGSGAILSSVTSGIGNDSVSWQLKWGTDTLLFGENYLCTTAFDSCSATTNNAGIGSPFAGNTTIIPIYRISQFPPSNSPFLQLPADNAVDLPLVVTFSWSPVQGASFYSLQVASDAGFNFMVYNKLRIIDTTQFVVTQTNNATLFWRVCAVNQMGTSAWSQSRRFTTIKALPPTPDLYSPANGDSGVSTNPQFRWSSGTAVYTYQLQIAITSDFKTTIIDTSGIAATSLQIYSLAKSTNYFWRMRTINSNGISPWSATFNFTTGALTSVASFDKTIRTTSCNKIQDILYYSINRKCFVKVRCYDVQGRAVATLIERIQEPGDYFLRLPITGWAKGTYLLQYEAEKVAKTILFVLVK